MSVTIRQGGPDRAMAEAEGGCHCGAVRLRVRLAAGLTTARRCTCSYCRVKGVIADEPLRRRVLLIDQATYAVVRETWSDAVTGAYSFDHIDDVPRYLVIAFDHERQHRAGVADNLRAQPMIPMTEMSP